MVFLAILITPALLQWSPDPARPESNRLPPILQEKREMIRLVVLFQMLLGRAGCVAGNAASCGPR